MTSALAVRSALLAASAIAATLTLFAPAASRAGGPLAPPCDTRQHDTHESTVCYAPAADTAGLAAGRNDETSAEDSTLAENAWDFTRPDSIPGFASTPYPVLSNPEILD